MAKAVKGCMNPECVANQKKTSFSLSNDYCPKCGQKLSYVCKDCRMELDDDTRRYCVRCENIRRDNREQLGKVVLGKIGEGAKAVGDFAVDAGKKTAAFVGDVADDIKEKTEQLAEARKAKKEGKDSTDNEVVEVEAVEVITEDENN